MDITIADVQAEIGRLATMLDRPFSEVLQEFIPDDYKERLLGRFPEWGDRSFGAFVEGPLRELDSEEFDFGNGDMEPYDVINFFLLATEGMVVCDEGHLRARLNDIADLLPERFGYVVSLFEYGEQGEVLENYLPWWSERTFHEFIGGVIASGYHEHPDVANLDVEPYNIFWTLDVLYRGLIAKSTESR